MNRDIHRPRIKSAYYINRDRLQQAKLRATFSRKPILLNGRRKLQKTTSKPYISKDSFIFDYVIGKGGFGRVWKIEHKSSKQTFAMKEMSKLRIVNKRSVHSVMNERKLLSTLHHYGIVNMEYAFQDRENLYLVMDLMAGGDLRYHIGRQKRFSEQKTRFMIACIVDSLEYIHSKGVIHRDIKPENLVLDQKGYVKITDFGIARNLLPENAKDTSGTPGYMAPEVMCRQNHSFVVDYFALGVMAFEFCMGRRPYLGRNRKEIRDEILSKQVQIRRYEIPEDWSLEAVDFINSMIERKPVQRLGFKGSAEVKNHPWLRDFPWEELRAGSLVAPFLPSALDNFDSRVTSDWTDEIDPSITIEVVENLFSGYSFDRRVNKS